MTVTPFYFRFYIYVQIFIRIEQILKKKFAGTVPSSLSSASVVQYSVKTSLPRVSVFVCNYYEQLLKNWVFYEISFVYITETMNNRKPQIEKA